MHWLEGGAALRGATETDRPSAGECPCHCTPTCSAALQNGLMAPDCEESEATREWLYTGIQMPGNALYVCQQLQQGVGLTDRKGVSVDRLLILSCSERKATAPGRLPAIDRYDGPAFRVLRKYFREGSPGAATVLILSAKYGLIAAERKIPWYDQRLSASMARTMRPRVLETARHVLQSRPWQSVGVCAGKEYQSALDGLAEFLPQGARVDLLAGGLGKRLAALRDWLRQDGV